MKLFLIVWVTLAFLFSGCTSPKTAQKEVYQNLNNDLIWMDVNAGDDAAEFVKQFPPERRATDDLYTHFFYADTGYDYLVVSAYDRELVSAMAVRDFPGHFTFFDEDPNTIEQRYKRMKRDMQIMELMLEAFGSFEEFNNESRND